jgi:hypothetical protein
MSNDTPETHAMLNYLSKEWPDPLHFELGLAGFARKMERERDAARFVIARAIENYSTIQWGFDGDCGANQVIAGLVEFQDNLQPPTYENP